MPLIEQLRFSSQDNGALYASVNFDLTTDLSPLSCDENLNCSIKGKSYKGPYYYNKEKGSNHAVTIVGWDDTISKDNFNDSNKPTSDGAWIVKNSYGEILEIEESGNKIGLLMGDKGYFYISYEDVNICTSLAGFYDTDTTVNDNSYSHSELGFVYSLELNADSIRAGAVYTKNSSSKQKIDKIVFGTEIAGMQYEVYFADNGSLTNLIKIADGTTSYSGYQSVDIPNNVIINNDKFSIVVKYIGVSGSTYLPVSIGIGGTAWENNVASPDSTFLSSDGVDWLDTSESIFGDKVAPFNNVIYVYTDNIDSDVTTTKTTTSSTTKSTTSSTTKSTTSSLNSSTTSTTETTQTTSSTKKDENKPNENGTIIIEPNEKNEGTIIQTETPEKNPSTSQSNVSFVLVLGIILLGFVGLSILKLRKLKD